jgi:hypothetical protein
MAPGLHRPVHETSRGAECTDSAAASGSVSGTAALSGAAAGAAPNPRSDAADPDAADADCRARTMSGVQSSRRD